MGPVRTEGPARQRLLRLMMHVLGSRTGAQLGLLDHRMKLLTLMCHPRGVFYRGLAAFSRRATYANITCDNTVPHWTASIAAWHAGTPLPPPPTAPQDCTTTPYPHVELVVNNSVGDDDSGGTAADPEGVSVALLTAGSADPPSCGQALALIFLGPLFVLCFFAPLFLCVVLPLASTIAICKRLVGVCFPPPQLPAALQLLTHTGGASGEAQEWSDPAAQAALEAEVAAEGSLQQWMAARLNELSWQKVHVRFRLRSDGLCALHTHPHIIVRNKWMSPFGMDVLAHVAATLRR